MKKIVGLFVFMFFLVVQTNAQIRVKAVPLAISEKLSNNIPVVVLKVKKLVAFENRGANPAPLFAGRTIPFGPKQLHKGLWVQTVKGQNIWRLKIKVENARQLNIYFTGFRLLPDDLLFIYTPRGQKTQSAITADNDGPYLATEIVEDNELMLELDRQSGRQVLPFKIVEIGVIEPENERDFGGAGPCEIPVNCSESRNFRQQKNGVARILVKEGSGLFWCTGSLINNAYYDGKEYFLTANHCGENAGQADYSNWLFYFNFESPDCSRPSSPPEIHSLSGAKLLASAPNSTSSGSDFKLLLLNKAIPQSYSPYFNGWDKSGNISNSGVTIHHPEGDIKMISTYSTSLIPTRYYGSESNTAGYYWKVQWAKTENGHGVTEGGSSGSPLFNSNGLIIGALTGGEASCEKSSSPDYYGRFSISWHPQGSDSTGQLDYWLNPSNSKIPDVLSGYDPYAGKVSVNFSATLTDLPAGGRTHFLNLCAGNITAYHWTFEGGNPETSNDKIPPDVRYNSQGKWTVKLEVEYADSTKFMQKKDYINVLPAIYPNPSPDKIYTIYLGEYEQDKVSIMIFDEIGKEINFFKSTFHPGSVNIDLSNNKRGLYLVRLVNNGRTMSYKLLIAK